MHVPDDFKTQEMCSEEVRNKPYMLLFVPDHLKTKEISNKPLREDSFSLACVPDWFVIQGQVKLWHDDNDYCNDAELVEWYEVYKKRWALKIQIDKKLLRVRWHPLRWWNWCVSETKRKRLRKSLPNISDSCF